MISGNRATLLDVNAVQPVGRDTELLSAALAGSPEAFSELYALYSPRLHKKIVSIMRNPADADDVLQETFLRVYLALHTFEGRSSFYSWLTRIAINTALMTLRKRRTHPEILFDPQPDAHAERFCFEVHDSAPTPDQVYDLRHRRITLIRAIRNLDARLRRPIQMRMVAGYSMQEIGRALNISVAAVKTRLHRARRQISAQLGAADYWH